LKDWLSIGYILAGNGFTKKEPQKETKMKLMKLSIRIPMGLTIADLILGIVVFTRISSQTGALPMTPFIIWIVSCVILIGITIWSALGFKGINKRK